MTIKYSALARGFYDTDLHRQIPDDAVTVSAKRHAALLAGQAEGYEIAPDTRGRPQLRRRSPATPEAARIACLKGIKREAARRIEQRLPLWRQLNALRDNSDPGFHEVDAIRQASNLIELQLAELTSVDAVAGFPVADHPLWPEFDTTAAKG
jgi:hypothetical protein